MMICKSLMAVAGVAAASFVLAQAEVEDRPIGDSFSVQEAPSAAALEPVTTTNNNNAPAQLQSNAGEMFYQMQVMQQELLELRGLVEQQTYQIKQLKQQRLDDYVDLDRRISALVQQPASASSSSQPSTSNATALQPSSTPNSSLAPASVPATSPASEIAHYKSATKLVLVNKDYDAGIARLQEHLALYPQGRYAGNAQYWLGEVYLAKSDLENARQWFDRLLNDFPLHAKVPDAKYKLGTVYHQLGSEPQAKQLLQEVSLGGGNVAKLANDYLKSNF